MDLRGFDTREWRGFSDREIKKLQLEGNQNSNNLHTGQSKSSNTKPPRRVIKKTPPISPVNPEQQTMSQKPIAKPKQPVVKPAASAAVQTQEENHDTNSSPSNTETADTPSQCIEEPATVEFKEESRKLEDLQARQREIEAENKRTKALIEQKLIERARIHKEESHKLQIVSQELAKLDKLVSKDVSVLRGKIEEANRLYNSARRRFELAEAEYISSKAALFQCSEQKELLSEHLCAVIQQNETRKAAKLSELMKTLNIENGDGVVTTPTEQPTTPVFLRTPTPGIQHWLSKNTDGTKSTNTADHVMTQNNANKSSVMETGHAIDHVTQTDSSECVSTGHMTGTTNEEKSMSTGKSHDSSSVNTDNDSTVPSNTSTTISTT